MTGGTPPLVATAQSWKLAAATAAQTQGLVVSGFANLPAACALLLHATAAGGAWIAALDKATPISAADGSRAPSVALAFTSSGLVQLGLGDVIMNGFAQPFVEGMMQVDRRHRLGDGDAELAWGARAEDGTPAASDGHALLLLYDTDHDALQTHVGAATAALGAAGVTILRRIALDLRPDDDCREHFGFVDGISQPIPYGEGTSDGTGAPYPHDPLHGVPLGEVLLGHRDAHGQVSTGPFIAGSQGPDGAFTPKISDPLEAAVDAMKNPATETLRDLGLNGSYIVVRELRQHVKEFWDSLAAQAGDLNARYPDKPPVDAKWLAERVVGRSLDGHMLAPGGATLPPVGGAADNDFLFYARDRLGQGCPLGSHVRRANPRDGLAYKDEVCGDLLHSANAHRILRRGRKFGGDVAGGSEPEGLLFMCLNGDIARQFEFVQQNWMLNPNFATLFDEVDPLVGPKGAMTLPDTPLRRRVTVATFITLVGGDYFFLPSLPTLRIFSALRPEPSSGEQP